MTFLCFRGFKWTKWKKGILGGILALITFALNVHPLVLPFPPNPDWPTFEYVKFKPGDILICKLNIFASHTMLAISNETVVHMIGDKSDISMIRKERWRDWHNARITPVVCSVQTAFYDRMFGNPKVDTVQRALRDVGRILHYNWISCNCEHWATWWRYGVIYSYQTLISGSYFCHWNMHPDPY